MGQKRLLVLIGVILMFLPFVPFCLALLVRVLGGVAGCSLQGEQCAVLGLDLGVSLKFWLDHSWNAIMWGLLVLGLGGLFFTFAVDGFGKRFFYGGCLPALGIIGLILLPIFVVVSASHSQCMINEGGVGDCIVWGTSMKNTFHSAAVVPWYFLLALPIGGGWIMVVSLVSLFAGRFLDKPQAQVR